MSVPQIIQVCRNAVRIILREQKFSGVGRARDAYGVERVSGTQLHSEIEKLRCGVNKIKLLALPCRPRMTIAGLPTHRAVIKLPHLVLCGEYPESVLEFATTEASNLQQP